MMKVCPSRPSSDEYYAHGEIMLWKTKVSYNYHLCCHVLDSQHLRTSDQQWFYRTRSDGLTIYSDLSVSPPLRRDLGT
jgi:hypothetical protein